MSIKGKATAVSKIKQEGCCKVTKQGAVDNKNQLMWLVAISISTFYNKLSCTQGFNVTNLIKYLTTGDLPKQHLM